MGEPTSVQVQGGKHGGKLFLGIGLASCVAALLAFPARSLAQFAYGAPQVGVPGGVGIGGNAFPGGSSFPGGYAAPGGNAFPSAPGAGPGGPQPQGLNGAPWILTPSLAVGEAYNDNVALAPKGQEVADFITTISPGANLVGQTAHVNINLTYDPQVLLFARETGSDQIQQRLLGVGSAELLPRTLFFEGRASIDQEFLRNNGAIGGTTLTSNGNLQTVETASASPYLLEHLGPYANSETRYRFSTVSVSGNTTAPEHIQEALERVASGEYFGPLFLMFTADGLKIDRLTGTTDPLGGTTAKDDYARIDFRYPVYQALSAMAGAGYERISDQTLVVQPRGPIWNVGLRYQPNPYATAAATYGRRFDRSDTELDAWYRPDEGLQVHAVYSLAVQTSLSQLSSSLNQLTPGPNGTLVNPETAQPVTGPPSATPGTVSSAFGIFSGSYLQRRAEVDFAATRGRDSYSLSAYELKISGSNGVVTAEKIDGLTAGWTRQLRPELTLKTSGTYFRATFQDGSGRNDNSYALSLGLAYALSAKTSAELTIYRFDTQSNFPGNTVTNDVITATLRKKF